MPENCLPHANSQFVVATAEVDEVYRQLRVFFCCDVCHPLTKDLDTGLEGGFVCRMVLGDEEKRRAYDSFGQSAPGGFSSDSQSQGFGQYSHVDPEELFRRIFKDSEFAFKEWTSGDRNFAESIFGFNRSREVVVNLTFEEAARGVTKEIVTNIVVVCPTCEGSRCQPGTGTMACPNCRGTGTETVSTGPFVMRSTCRRCQGTGSVVRYPCRACEGTGQTVGRQQVKIAIPPGVEDGQMLRVSVGDARRAPQELFVTVRVDSSRLFRRDGADVHSDITISLAQAALGGKVRVPGIYEQVLVTIPAGSSSRDRIRLPGKGISRVNGRGYGDHYIHINIATPKRLTELQRALLLAFAETETDVKGSVDGVASTESAGRRAIDNTQGFLLSRIRAATGTSPVSDPPQASKSPSSESPEASSEFLRKRKSSERCSDCTPGFSVDVLICWACSVFYFSLDLDTSPSLYSPSPEKEVAYHSYGIYKS
ncbi:DnaJ sub A member 3, mitochondrial [Sparganum proliferum]